MFRAQGVFLHRSKRFLFARVLSETLRSQPGPVRTVVVFWVMVCLVETSRFLRVPVFPTQGGGFLLLYAITRNRIITWSESCY